MSAACQADALWYTDRRSVRYVVDGYVWWGMDTEERGWGRWKVRAGRGEGGELLVE